MKRIILSATLLYALISFTACSKSSGNGGDGSTDFATVETTVITDFVNNTAVAQYDSLVKAGTALNNNIIALNATPTDDLLKAAQASWKKMRVFWEGSEGFLIGPVEANDYDPNSDTWPTDYHQMDSLLSSTNPLTTTDVANLPQTLRGYHPIEYLIFGEGGTRTVAELDDRKKKYLVSLSDDLLNNNVQPLLDSWKSSFSQTVLTAGASGNSTYGTKQSLFLDLVTDNGMAGICNEVGQQNEDGKMYNPYSTSDPSLCESPYSGNSLIDFKNNIKSVQLVYLGQNGGKGLSALVAARNTALDNQIQAAITAAVNSFDNISGPDNLSFEQAIITNRGAVLATMQQLNSLQTLLETDLADFITTNVKD